MNRIDGSHTQLTPTGHTHTTGKQLLQEEFIQKNPAWVKELELMLKMKKKAEIQVSVLRLMNARKCLTVHGYGHLTNPDHNNTTTTTLQALSAFGFQYVTEVYLPRKLEKGDWI